MAPTEPTWRYATGWDRFLAGLVDAIFLLPFYALPVGYFLLLFPNGSGGALTGGFLITAVLMFVAVTASTLLTSVIKGRTGRFLGGGLNRVYLVSIRTGGPAGFTTVWRRSLMRAQLRNRRYGPAPGSVENLIDQRYGTRTVKLLNPDAALPIGLLTRASEPGQSVHIDPAYFADG